MKINITNADFRTLLEMTYIAEWVITAFETGEEKEKAKKYSEFSEKIYFLAKDFGCGKFVEYDPKYKKHYPTGEFEEVIDEMGFIDEFENESLWDNLAYRLASRDAVKELGEEAFVKLSRDKRMSLIWKIQERYDAEFSIYGLDRLEIIG